MTFVKSYLGSQICFRKVSTIYYKEYQPLNKVKYSPLSGEYKSDWMVLKNFYEIERNILEPYY